MRTMQALRSWSLLPRLVLAWFALTLGVAAASPALHPQSLELVCSTGGIVKLVVMGEDGQPAKAGHHTLDCPMCLAATLPPPLPPTTAAPAPLPLAAVHPFAAAHIAALAGAPLPPRGPPASA